MKTSKPIYFKLKLWFSQSSLHLFWCFYEAFQSRNWKCFHKNFVDVYWKNLLLHQSIQLQTRWIMLKKIFYCIQKFDISKSENRCVWRMWKIFFTALDENEGALSKWIYNVFFLFLIYMAWVFASNCFMQLFMKNSEFIGFIGFLVSRIIPFKLKEIIIIFLASKFICLILSLISLASRAPLRLWKISER